LLGRFEERVIDLKVRRHVRRLFHTRGVSIDAHSPIPLRAPAEPRKIPQRIGGCTDSRRGVHPLGEASRRGAGAQGWELDNESSTPPTPRLVNRVPPLRLRASAGEPPPLPLRAPHPSISAQ
jgi:hypothetical protein